MVTAERVAKWLGLSRFRRQIGAWDFAVAAVIALVVLRVFQLRWPVDTPYLIAESDSAMLSSFAAALDYPERFANDSFLSKVSNFDFYATVQVPYTRLVVGLFGGDYARAFLSALVPLTFLQLLGFYVFGRALYRHRFIAFLLAMSCMFSFKFRLLSTYWGVHGWTTARDWFAAALPWVLALAVTCHGKPRRFLGVMVGSGIFVYLHPVSTPAWALALWCSLWLCWDDTGVRFLRRFGWMFLCGLVFLVVAAPFVITYLGAHESGGTSDPEVVRRIIAYRFLPAYSQVPETATKIVKHFATGGFLQMGALGAVSVAWLSRRDRRNVQMVAVWAAIIVLMALIIPVIEHRWVKEVGRVAFEYDLIRNVRYLFLLAWVLILWPFAVVAKRARGRGYGMFAAGCALVLLGGVSLVRPVPMITGDKRTLVEHAFEAPERTARAEHKRKKGLVKRTHHAKALTFIHDHTPTDAVFVSNRRAEGLHIRYAGLRAVAHEWKDGGALIYSDFEGLKEWYRQSRKMRRLAKGRDAEGFTLFANAARDLGANHILYRGRLSKEILKKAKAKRLYMNRSFTVLALR